MKHGSMVSSKIVTIILILIVLGVLIYWIPSTIIKLKNKLLGLTGTIPCKERIIEDCMCGNTQVNYEKLTTTTYCCNGQVTVLPCKHSNETFVYIQYVSPPLSFTTPWLGKTKPVITSPTIKIFFDKQLNPHLNPEKVVDVYEDDRFFHIGLPSKMEHWKKVLNLDIKIDLKNNAIIIGRLEKNKNYLIRISSVPLTPEGSQISEDSRWLTFRTGVWDEA